MRQARCDARLNLIRVCLYLLLLHKISRKAWKLSSSAKVGQVSREGVVEGCKLIYLDCRPFLQMTHRVELALPFIFLVLGVLRKHGVHQGLTLRSQTQQCLGQL